MRELQKKIVEYEHVLPEIDPQEEIRKTVDFLKDYLKANPFLKSYVLGISGGQDSTLTGKLTQMAISEMREETGDDSYKFIAVRLPYGVQADAADAADAVAFIQPDVDLIENIKPATDAMVATLTRATSKPGKEWSCSMPLPGPIRARLWGLTTQPKTSLASIPSTAMARLT